jgi:NDP-sugar pyrophosphorylase family protein
MQIIIPMTGEGSRFVRAGYSRLKPFIKIHGSPMIRWVVSMFPGAEENITFICRKEQAENNYYFKKELLSAAPNASIFFINKWEKLGPAHDVLMSSEIIDDDQPVLVSYCDFYARWNFSKFKSLVKNNKIDGVVPCYTGFHPHIVHKENLYASCDTDRKFFLRKISEKAQLNLNKEDDLYSPGLYYFSSGKLLKKYCQQLVDSQQRINGEYYMSLPYNFLVKDGLKVLCPPIIDYFCQWGTPKDLEEYLMWYKWGASVRKKK